MTRYFVNEREINPPGDISSLDQILKHIETAHLPPNTVVRQIQIDGLSVSPDAISQSMGDILGPMENSEKVEVFTGKISDIARESIIEAIDYIDRAERLILSLATSFQISPGPEAFENLRQLFEGFYWLNLLLDKLEQNYHVNLDDILIREKPAREHLQKFIIILKQVVDSQEKGDFILISDLLEYEILPLVPIWKEIFQFFSEKALAAS
jgi:hypothetical protein